MLEDVFLSLEKDWEVKVVAVVTEALENHEKRVVYLRGSIYGSFNLIITLTRLAAARTDFRSRGMLQGTCLGSVIQALGKYSTKDLFFFNCNTKDSERSGSRIHTS